jgi:hypothetical protein
VVEGITGNLAAPLKANEAVVRLKMSGVTVKGKRAVLEPIRFILRI